jgi:hypothetical protein
MYALRGSLRKKFRKALGLEKSEIEQDSPAGSTLAFHVRVDDPKALSEILPESGNPLKDVKTRNNEMKATSRARELLAGEVATEHDVRDMITEMIEVGKTQTKVAARLGVSTSALGDILHGRRGVGGKVARNLGYERVVVYRRSRHEDTEHRERGIL